MENQKAIEIIKKCTMLSCEYHIKDKCGKDYRERDKDFEETKKIAISAIEKQIPKKRIKGKMYKVLGYYQCPMCGGMLTTNKGFCEDCGQAIDWSKDE